MSGQLEWRPVVGFPDYEVCENGIVRRCIPDCQGRGLGRLIMSRPPRGKMRRSIALHFQKRSTERVLAEIVLEAFCGSRPSPDHTPAYRDSDSENVCSTNLFWEIRPNVDATAGLGLKWRFIPGFPGYEIREDGFVRCHKGRRPGRIVPQQEDPRYGHMYVAVWNEAGRRTTGTIQNLLARAFHGPAPSADHEAAHNDGNPKNNHWRNIRWATVRENSEDRRRHGTMLIGVKNPNAVFSIALVQELRRQFKNSYHGQIADLARQYGVSEYAVHCVKHQKTWKGIE